MKQGDLVNFHTEATVFASAVKEYANPGIVLDIKCKDGWFNSDLFMQVMWADGRITNEHASYLRKVCDEDR